MQGQHEQAIVRLVQNCSGEELTAQLQKMLGFRHERCAKLEDHANDLRREIQALKAAGVRMCVVHCRFLPPEHWGVRTSRPPQRVSLLCFVTRPLSAPHCLQTISAGGKRTS